MLREKVETKERQKEDLESGPTERIYTQSYLKLAEENRKLEEKIIAEEKIGKKHSIEGQKDSRLFLFHYLNAKSKQNSEPEIVKKAKMTEKEAKIEENTVEIGEKAGKRGKTEEKKVEIATVLVPEGEKKSEEVILSARERYLQRKAAQNQL